MKHEYKIYQLDAHNENVIKDHKMYESWETLNRTAGFNFRQYKLVWEGEIEVLEDSVDETILDELFSEFNITHPKNYHGRSMSTSDVVVLDEVMYYCDSFGWEKI